MTENIALIRKMYDAFGRGDIAYILQNLTDDVEWTSIGPASIPYAGTFRGPAEVTKFFQALATTQSGQRLTMPEFVASGDKVVAIGRYACTVTATGKYSDAPVVHVFTIRDGKVAAFLDFVDTAAVVEAYSAAAA